MHAGPANWIPNPAGLVAAGGLKQPLYGIAWASLVLLCHQSTRLRALVSWRPLTFLGAISYSLYLIHLPVIGLVYDLAPLAVRVSVLLPFDAVALAVAAGMVFHLCVERPCMAPATRRRIEPVLARWLDWTDTLYGRLTRSVPRPPSVPAAAPRPAPASPAAGRRDGQERLSP
ncbi:MAG: hypothetical protein NVSMB65_19100 [Chloroflexota bacterium]